MHQEKLGGAVTLVGASQTGPPTVNTLGLEDDGERGAFILESLEPPFQVSS